MQIPVKGEGVGRPVLEWPVSKAAERPVRFCESGSLVAYLRHEDDFDVGGTEQAGGQAWVEQEPWARC